MSTHIFGAILTGHGVASNNRGLTEGNITTLQKLVWHDQVHTTVSAESIRFALRRQLERFEECNRTFDEDQRKHTWRDPDFTRWAKAGEKPFIDDDLLGFMSAKAAKEDGSTKGKGTINVRRSVLEISRAVSVSPWAGDVTFNAASPGATPSAEKRGSAPVPYGTEIHATRYQYGFAMTPDRLKDPARAVTALKCLCAIGEVAGNHGRFLFDFSPEAVILRVTDEPAPRILYAFDVEGEQITVPSLIRKVKAGDLDPRELIIGGALNETLSPEQREALGPVEMHAGVKAAFDAVCRRLDAR